MANQNPVKAIVEDREGAFNLYWNGKVYGSKIYATLNRRGGGSEIKISFDAQTHRADAGTRSTSYAKQAFHALEQQGIEPFNKFDFSQYDSPYAYEK